MTALLTKLRHGLERKLTEVDNASFGRVISRLQLRDIDNLAAHAGGGDEASIGEALQLVAIEVGAFLLLTTPVGSARARAVEGAVQVGGHDLAIVVQRAVDHGPLGPWNACVRHEDVQPAVELLDDLIDHLGGVLGVSDIDLIGAA